MYVTYAGLSYKYPFCVCLPKCRKINCHFSLIFLLLSSSGTKCPCSRISFQGCLYRGSSSPTKTKGGRAYCPQRRMQVLLVQGPPAALATAAALSNILSFDSDPGIMCLLQALAKPVKSQALHSAWHKIIFVLIKLTCFTAQHTF